jgi:hypothetical protein
MALSVAPVAHHVGETSSNAIPVDERCLAVIEAEPEGEAMRNFEGIIAVGIISVDD